MSSIVRLFSAEVLSFVGMFVIKAQKYLKLKKKDNIFVINQYHLKQLIKLTETDT